MKSGAAPFRVKGLYEPKGPYSHAVRAGDFLFVSGLGPVDPATGSVVKGTIEEETRRTLDNLLILLKEAGRTAADVAKTTVYLLDMRDFAAMNAVYAAYFPENPPARTTIQAAGLPAGISIEIDAIAYVGED
jgi:2-iminobutanoate/2-iminopropanoate deaminase